MSSSNTCLNSFFTAPSSTVCAFWVVSEPRHSEACPRCGIHFQRDFEASACPEVRGSVAFSSLPIASSRAFWATTAEAKILLWR